MSLTPRWETLNWGFYLPIQYNRQGNFWAGIAIKIGPFVGGIHNIGIFKRSNAEWRWLYSIEYSPLQKKGTKIEIRLF